MAAIVAPAPWTYGYKPITKLQMSRSHVPGYGFVSPDSVDKWRKLPKHPPTRWLTSPLTGRQYKAVSTDIEDFINTASVYGYNNVQFMTFTAEHGLQNNEEGMAAFVEYSFAEDTKHVYKTEGCGHILYLEYNQDTQVMRITFWDNSVVVYFRIPRQVYGELYTLAVLKSKTTHTFDGSERHELGVRFWDLVRIRGSKHGARYRFVYMSEGSYPTTHNTPGRPNTRLYYVTDKPERLTNKKLKQLGKDQLVDYREGVDRIKKNLYDEYERMYAKEQGIDPKITTEIDENGVEHVVAIYDTSKIDKKKFEKWLRSTDYAEDLREELAEFKEHSNMLAANKGVLNTTQVASMITDPEEARRLENVAMTRKDEGSSMLQEAYKTDKREFNRLYNELQQEASLLRGSARKTYDNIAASMSGKPLIDIAKEQEAFLTKYGLWETD